MQERRFSRNLELRIKIEKLLEQARENEKKQLAFDVFNLSILATQSADKLLTLLLEKQKKFRIDEIHLYLFDQSNAIEKLLTESCHQSFSTLQFIDKDTPNLLNNIPNNPVLGERILNQYDWLCLPTSQGEFQSAALLPLICGEKKIGAQLLLSHDKNRYSKNDSTDFLAKLASMIAISIENCINRQKIIQLGFQDVLTNAYNRRYFDENFKQIVKQCHLENQDLVCLFIDIDFFKRINDNYGHQTGDKVLISLVEIVKQQLNKSDILARYGGEEFAVILPNTSLEVGLQTAHKIRQSVESTTFSCMNQQLKLSVSIGVSALSQLSETTTLSADNIKQLNDILLGFADDALYQAKDTGRNKVVLKAL